MHVVLKLPNRHVQNIPDSDVHPGSQASWADQVLTSSLRYISKTAAIWLMPWQ